MASLRSCLRKVKKHREETAGVTSLMAPSTCADSSTLKVKLAQARELAAKVQRHKETGEGQSQQQGAESQDRRVCFYTKMMFLCCCATINSEPKSAKLSKPSNQPSIHLLLLGWAWSQGQPAAVI